MGLDVLLYAEGEVSDEYLAAANKFFEERCGKLSFSPEEPTLERWVQEGCSPRIQVNTLDRFYGIGYERGDWPRIYGFIRTLQGAFPGCPVFYASDAHEEGEQVTDESMAELWNHWCGPQGQDYHHRWSDWAKRSRVFPP
jgi:hypothetical protein